MFSTILQVEFFPFPRLPLGNACLWKQTDSEQTDFAFDGEMTATEVCTSRKDVGNKPLKMSENDSADEGQKFLFHFDLFIYLFF